MYKGVDCATPLTARSAAGIAAAGYDFVGRYLVPQTPTLRWKALTVSELDIIRSAGLGILAVYETTADRPKDGAAAGIKDGRMAKALADEFKIPHNAAIYFAVDYEAQAGDMAAIEAYLRAAKSQLGPYRIGVYGSFRVIETMHLLGAADCYWQCIAWSYRKNSEHRNVYQHTAGVSVAGVAVDINSCADLEAAGIFGGDEDNMTGEQIYNKLNEHLASLPVPEWAQAELLEAQELGITDGTRPQQLIPRYQAAIMAKRAVKAAIKK